MRGDVIFLMNYIWAGLMLVSIIFAFITGRTNELSNAVIDGASQAIQLVISMTGLVCFWTGLMSIADKGGLTAILAKAFKPIMKKLFPEYEEDSPAIKAICMNITANLLGLGNAATPFGIKAMQEMAKTRPEKLKTTASNSMVMFVVINTASLQIIPTMMSMLRVNHGSKSPFDIMPAVWITSISALISGILVAKLLERREHSG